MIPLLASEGEAVFGALIYGLLAVLVLFIAVVWIIFPFLVNSKFNELLRVQQETNRLLKFIAEGSRGTEAPPTLPKADPPPLPTSAYKID